jgi:16S rRNA (guanine527-N7)-methyltransferase
MAIGSAAWKGLIRDGGARLGVPVTGRQLELFASHAAILLHWNRRTNLTAITEPRAVAVRHVLDSLAPLPWLPERGALLDIGSGGGFPGLVLKIARPALSVSLIDAARKRVSFLSHAIRSLGLEDVTACHVRAEALERQTQGTRGFDVVICRALASLHELIPMALPLLAPAGSLIAMKGRTGEAEAEIADCRERFTPAGAEGPVHGGSSLVLSLRAYTLPFEETERTLVTVARRL